MSDPSLSDAYAPFLANEFDPQDYANEILKVEGGTSATQDVGDVGAALAGLNSSVEIFNRALRTEITTHHAALLAHAAAIGSMGGSLQKVRTGLTEVDGGVDRLRKKISAPHAALASALARMSKLQRAADLVRRANRFVILARRLEVQMTELEASDGAAGSERGERALAEAALTLAEIELLKEEPSASSEDGRESDQLPLRSLPAIEANLPAIDAGRAKVIDQMQALVREGLGKLNTGVLASSLQTAYNLSVLPTLVTSLVADLNEAIEGRIRATFDMASLAREVGGKDAVSSATSFVYKSRARNEPSNAALPQWTATLWARLERLVEDMSSCCVKVYTLEKVLRARKDPQTRVSFLDTAMQTLENAPSTSFWTTLAHALESHARDAAKSSTFVQQTLSTGYPRLLRLLQEFFGKIAVHTDTVYRATQQSPETLVVLHAVATFETLYVNRATNRMNEAVAAAVAGGTRSPPSVNDGLSASRVIINELDAARFDPLLIKSIAKAAAKAVDIFVSRIDKLVASDYSSTSLIGPTATPAQLVNADIVNASYHFWSSLTSVLQDHTQSVQDAVSPSVASIRGVYLGVVESLLAAIRRELLGIIAKMHRADFNVASAGGGAATSPYMKEFSDKIAFIRLQVLAPYRVPALAQDWVTDIGRQLFQSFVLHASIVRPINEPGKLRLTSDMTALEFSVAQMLSDYKLSLAALGDDFKALRAFRPLLFAEDAQLAETDGVSVLVLLHQVIVRSPLPLPTQQHDWSEIEYTRWLAEHSPSEQYRLIDAIVRQWEAKADYEAAKPYVEILRKLLQTVQS